MSAPTFTQITDTSLFGLSTALDSGVDGYWAGYFNIDGQLHGTMSTADIWQNTSGFYLFLKQTPGDWATFQNQLKLLLQGLNPQGQLRSLWLDNSGGSYRYWPSTAMDARCMGSGASIEWSIARSFSFITGSYHIVVPGKSSLDYINDTDGGGFTISGNGMFNGPLGGYSYGSYKIPFSGDAVGCITGVLSIPAASGEDTLWTSLKVGLQYAGAPGFLENDGDDAPKETGATALLYMPVFYDQSNAMGLVAAFDPLNPLISARSFVSLLESDGSSPGVIHSYLRTTRGYAIGLEPQPASGSVPAARLVFGMSPSNAFMDGVNDYHLSPEGAFKITVTVPPASVKSAEGATAIESYQLLLGLSGLEYVALGGANNDLIVFKGGQPAYVPQRVGSSEAQPISDALTNAATTSYLTVIPDTGNAGRTYFAQPKQAPVFSGKDNLSSDLLAFNAMPAYQLSAGMSTFPKVFPSGIYAGLDADLTFLATKLEHASISPYRHFTLGAAYGIDAIPVEERVMPKRRIRAATDPLGVTPQGLIAELNGTYDEFDGLYIGNMPNSTYEKVALTMVSGKFKESLQSNQLFFAAINVDELMKGTSVEYRLTEDPDKDLLRAQGVPEDIITDVYNAVEVGKIYETESDFAAVAEGPSTATYWPNVLDVAGILKVEMDDWTFQLSPRSWRSVDKYPDSPTLMIAKFCNRSLEELAGDSSSWLWPEVATPDGGTLGFTQDILQGIIENSKSPEATEDYRIFYNTVASNPNWNGFLFLNTPVDVTEFPDDLKFLLAGVDMTKFYAHHIGFSQTPFTVTSGRPQLDQTAAFGLVDYTDSKDLYRDESIQFAFKTMQLKARFANASLADFSTQIELMLNKLLATPLAKVQAARGNNLIINGTYQNVGGSPTYAFALTGENVFTGSQSALVSMEVLSVRLVTGGKPDDPETILTSFMLTGNLRFLVDYNFDLFSFGPDPEKGTDGFLRFNGLEIDMIFNITTPEDQTFVAHEEALSFDLSNSVVRNSGLFNNFPLTMGNLIASPNLSGEGEAPSGQTPEDLGFSSVSAPIDQTPMVPTWFGMQYILDMGTLGALSGGQSLKVTILVAWSEGSAQGDSPSYVGLKLPNIPSVGGSLPLQGVLKLGFRNFVFQTYTKTSEGEEKLAYNLRLKRFALSILLWSFPPGNFDVVLFGNPDDPKGALGWYAAYDNGESGGDGATAIEGDAVESQKVKLSRTERKQLTGRRTPPIK
ncbi:MAG: hypothetical protein EP346_07905 [Bacteroidetes bacterium]|nr:MAG: hypothetical protein EP346_07905 [Bacteroidota bacterium]